MGRFSSPLSNPTVGVLDTQVNPGAESDDSADILRKHLNPALKGDAWSALIAAIATGDEADVTTARRAFDQLFKTSASGLYLTRKAADDGTRRPANVGMPDALFRDYAIKTTNGKLVENALLDILEIFYGSDTVRAYGETEAAGDYALTSGDDLTLRLDERIDVTVVFTTDDFVTIGAATAHEVAAALNRVLRFNHTLAYALAMQDPDTGEEGVRIYSGALGLGSSVRVTGGRAQRVLRFTTLLDTFPNLPTLPTWTLTFTAATGVLRFSPTSDFDISQVRIGDYVTVYGTMFNAANRGTFTVTNTFWTPASQWFEVVNIDGVAQGGVLQLAENDLLAFRPIRETIYSGGARPALVAVTGNGVEMVLPATSRAVGRTELTAAYGQARAAVAVSALKRVGTTVTVTATAHGLSVGDRFILDAVEGTPALPATIAGVAPNLNASLVSLWAPTAAPSARSRHAAVALQDGRGFLVGGNNGVANVATVDLFTMTGPVTLAGGEERYTGVWAVGTAMPVTPGEEPINHATSVLTDVVRNGQVLVTGGEDSGFATQFDKTFLYTPDGGAGVWAAGPLLSIPRARHAQIVLSDGLVLISGGRTIGSTVASCERYNPATNLIVATASMSVPRDSHALVTLSDGRVLAVGGNTYNPVGITPKCDIYDPVANTWTATGPMTQGRRHCAATLLPDGRVLAVGGYGNNPTQPAVSSTQLRTCEIWDPTTGRWHPGPSTTQKRWHTTLVVVDDRVYALGDSADTFVGPDYTDTTEYLDLNTMQWVRTAASMTVGRTESRVVALVNGTYLLSGGYDNATGLTPANNYVLVLASNTSSRGSLNGEHVVATVVDPNSLTFETPESGYYLNAGTDTTMTPVAAVTGSFAGPYTYDPAVGVAITDTESETTETRYAGQQYADLDVVDAEAFPDERGWLVMNFGYKNQVGPVPYLGRLSATKLALAYNYRFPTTIPSGSNVALLAQKGAYTPETPEELGSFYLTASPAGRVAAQQALEDAVGAGIAVDVIVVYPGDRGLGGESLPSEGAQKLADKVSVWGSDELDAELAAAREG